MKSDFSGCPMPNILFRPRNLEILEKKAGEKFC